jgi:hypothetical protein
MALKWRKFSKIFENFLFPDDDEDDVYIIKITTWQWFIKYRPARMAEV